MSQSTTCTLTPGCTRRVVRHVITRSGVFSGCDECAVGATRRKRDLVDVPAYPRDPQRDRPVVDALYAHTVACLEQKIGRSVVEVEFAICYYALCDDVTVWSGAVTPRGQGQEATHELLTTAADDAADRHYGGGCDE
ncbi:MAG: hypothetical protein GEV09_23495 [Pseudonocardiaceae bacterium]|nr:hypothetical protein [Pseudonocardiaceae bacterium]